MADGATSVGFPGRQGVKRLDTPIRDEVRCLMTGLQKEREANHAMQATPNGASDGLCYTLSIRNQRRRRNSILALWCNIEIDLFKNGLLELKKGVTH